MYEVTLGTDGIQQLGWAAHGCTFTNEDGVGDSPDSYAFDGKRVKKWNVQCAAYGEAWAAGDVIGVLIDLERGEVRYTKQGQDLGVAYTQVRRKVPGLAYVPALSLSRNESCAVNFGARPFLHPQAGYASLQCPPEGAVQARSLLNYLGEISDAIWHPCGDDSIEVKEQP